MFRAEAALVRKQELRLNKSLADPNRVLVLDGTLFLCAKGQIYFLPAKYFPRFLLMDAE